VGPAGADDAVAAVETTPGRVTDARGPTDLDSSDVAEELQPEGKSHESLRYAARQEAGLRVFLDEGDFDAFTTSFEDLGGLRQLPGLAVQRLMADGYGFGAEGDWKTAILVRLGKGMGYGLPG